jgi:hypothetical protein
MSLPENKRTLRTTKAKIAGFQKAVKNFDGTTDAVRSVVATAGSICVKSVSLLFSMAEYLYETALANPGSLKQFAILTRRLSDRLPRCGPVPGR